MKTLITTTFICLTLAACTSSNENEAATLTAKVGQHLELKAVNLKANDGIQFDMKKTNGMMAEVFLGDTIGYQYYVNGEKHGPYFNLNGPGFKKHTIGERADGFYRHDKKHGYFMRYVSPGDPHYIALYKEDEFQWAETYYAYAMDIYPRMPFKAQEDEELTIEAPHPNGITWFKGSYKNGKPFGTHKIYDDHGRKTGEINYAKNTVTEYWWYDDGMEKNKWTFDESDIYNWY